MSPPQNKNSSLHRFADWFQDDGIDLGLIVLPIVIGLAQLFLINDVLDLIAKVGGNKSVWRAIGLIGMLITIPLFVLIALAARRKAKRLSAVEAENELLQTQVITLTGSLFGYAEDLLKNWSQLLGFGGWNGVAERITIYAHDGTNLFTAFGRFSSNPTYRRKSQRAYYMEDQGCIAKAWQDGWYFRNDYPDPNHNTDAWVACCTQDGMAERTARQIKMKSRLYCGFRVDSRTQESLAVVIIEATDPARYTSEELRFFVEDFVDDLREPLTRFQAVLPRSASARELGY